MEAVQSESARSWLDEAASAIYDVLAERTWAPTSEREIEVFAESASTLAAKGASPAELELVLEHWRNGPFRHSTPKPPVIARQWEALRPEPQLDISALVPAHGAGRPDQVLEGA